MAPRTQISASNRPTPITAELLTPAAFIGFGEVVQNPAAHDGAPKLEMVEANQGSATKWLDVTRMRNWYHLAQSRKAAEVKMNMFVCKPRPLERRSDGKEVFPVKVLERHPFTPQTFVPMGLGRDDRATWYLVIVAPTLPQTSRAGSADSDLQPPYPRPEPRRKRSLKERLLGMRPNPYTNDYSLSTTTLSSGTSPAVARPKGPGLPDLDNLKAFIARGDQAVTYGPGTWHAPMVVLGEKAIEFVVVQYMNGVGVEDCQEVDIEASTADERLAVDVNGITESPRSPRAKL